MPCAEAPVTSESETIVSKRKLIEHAANDVADTEELPTPHPIERLI